MNRQFSLRVGTLSLILVSAATVHGQLSQSFVGDFPDLGGLNQEYLLSNAAVWEENGYVTVTPGEGGLNGGFFTNAIGKGSYESLQISFDLRLSETSENGGADGYGFALLPTEIYGSSITGNNPAFSEEVNLTGAFGLGFDTFDNNDADRIPIDETVPDAATGDRFNESSISVHWDGNLLGSIYGPAQDPPFNLEVMTGSSNFNVNLFIVPIAGDSAVTLTLTNLDSGDTLVPFANLEMPGMDIQDYRIGFRGRTGGAWNKQEVGNVTIIEDEGDPIVLTLGEPGVIPRPSLVDGGTPFFGLGAEGRHASGEGPLLQADGEPVGEVDGYLSLTQALGAEQNFITFASTENGTRLGLGGRTGGAADDYQIDNVEQTSTASKITTEFDFRAIRGSGADGFSVVMVNSEDYPDDETPVVGTATVEGWNVAEEPLISGGLGVGFKTFENEELRLRYDGQELETVEEPTVQIVNGEWQHVTLVTEACERDAAEGLCVTMTMEGFDSSGDAATDVPFNDVFIAGASLGNLVIGGGGELAGDITGDGKVDAADLNIIGINWQTAVDVNTNGDVDGSGFVDAADLNVIGINWQKSIGDAAATAAVPEPVGASLALFGALGALAFRRRNRV